MTSYVYNPSKKVTELLSQYLEFDPEQLQLGIWSGHLSLADVSLRQDAMYDILNRQILRVSDEQYAKPPLRFKLVSGTVGGLSIKIPWKRLVWGQGDVKAELNDVTIILALESREEAEARKAGCDEPAIPEASDGEGDEAFETDDPRLRTKGFRDKKQKRIREAERRHMQGRPMATWLSALKKRDDAEKAKAIIRENAPLKTEGRLEKWIKGATNDFFWRFYAGLEMSISNVKVVLIQEGVEIGLILPKSVALAGKNKGTSGKTPDETSVGKNSSTIATPPKDMLYESAYEDGEHIDKNIKYLGIGVYVRKAVVSPKSLAAGSMPLLDVSTNEYILRPVDLYLNFSLFYPYPLERRKRNAKRRVGAVVNITAAEASTEGSRSGESSGKRRRGKREKINVTGTESTEWNSVRPTSPNLQHLDTTPGPPDRAMSSSGRQFSYFHRIASIPSLNVTPEHRRVQSAIPIGIMTGRRASMATPLPTTSVSRLQRSTISEVQEMAPLALPDSLNIGYDTREVRGTKSLAAHLDVRFSVDEMQIVCSTRHYIMVRSFLASSSRIRNGRPERTIHSVIEQERAHRRSLTVQTHTGFLSPGMSDETFASMFDAVSSKKDVAMSLRQQNAEVRLELIGAHSERSHIVRSWWRYVVGAIVWELRQRRKLRTRFQQRYLSFSWKRQAYKRRDYVRIYIQQRLMPVEQRSQLISTEDELLSLEDILCIEQILLYRSLARAVHVRGENCFPESIAELHSEHVTTDQAHAFQHSNMKPSDFAPQISTPVRGSRFEGEKTDSIAGDEPSSILSVVERLCETARLRWDGDDEEDLEGFESHNTWTDLIRKAHKTLRADEMTADESRTVRTQLSSNAHTYGVRSNLDVESRNSTEFNGPMKFSFAFDMKRFEFIIVQEANLFDGHNEHCPSLYDDESMASVGESSQVSGLTDDQNSLSADVPITDGGESREVIRASTDFLLFRIPENVLLRFIVAPISYTSTGRSGATRNFDISIGCVNAFGVDDVCILSIGRRPSGIPVEEVDIQPKWSMAFSDQNAQVPGLHTSKQAVALSLIAGEDETLLQCDVPTIRANMDLRTGSGLLKALNDRIVPLPTPLLQTSATEEVRLYVLRQSTSSYLSALTCSIRVAGWNIVLPRNWVDTVAGSSPNSTDGSLQLTNVSRPASVILQAELFEIYSGAAVEKLRSIQNYEESSDPSGKVETSEKATRHLRMLDLSGIICDSAFSQVWVASACGLDCALDASNEPDSIRPSKMSLFESPIELESFCTVNSNSLLDTNRANKEIVMELSPVHVLVSEQRLKILAETFSLFATSGIEKKTKHSTYDQLHLRLEVLSRFVVYSVDLAVKRVRLSLVADAGKTIHTTALSKEEQFRDALLAFLRVASHFDLSFPNEEATSSAMQVCIDRLTGLGLSLEHSWEATNTALLHFLEAMATVRQSGSEPFRGSLTFERHSDDPHSIRRDATDESMRDAANRTIQAFAVRVAEILKLGAVPSENQFVIDVPSGVSCSFIKSYYDQHLVVAIPSLFITDAAGIHILRVTPSESGEGSDMASAKKGEGPSAQRFSDWGICIRCFNVDKKFPFGRGGLPLSCLSTDSLVDQDHDFRRQESVTDIQFGDIDILFSNDVLNDAIDSVTTAGAIAIALLQSNLQKTNGSSYKARSHVLIAVCSSSLLFVADNFAPFCRLTVFEAVVRGAFGDQKEDEVKTASFCRSMSFLNLSPEGELFPVSVETIPSLTRVPVKFVITSSKSRTGVCLEFRGIRAFFLRQFLNECLQYFTSDHFGVGRLMKTLQGKRITSSNKRSLGYELKLYDSSILFPRSSTQADMLSMEFRRITVSFSQVPNSFVLPTESAPLMIEQPVSDVSDFHDCFVSMKDEGDPKNPVIKVSRTTIDVEDLKLLTAISEDVFRHEASFRHFYGVDGRAVANKPVYERFQQDDAQTGPITCVDELLWREITVQSCCIYAVVDFAPELRILVCDPPALENNTMGLEVSLQDFCLLLSLWYANMKELPVMFPYSPSEIEAASRGSSFEYPEPGTSAYRLLLKDPSGFSSDSAFLFKELSFRCIIESESMMLDASGIDVHFCGAAVHVTNDTHDVARVSFSSKGLTIKDESKLFKEVLRIDPRDATTDGNADYAWPDLAFGLDLNQMCFDQPLAQAFQLSVFTTPISSLYNLGMESPSITMSDLSTVFEFIGFVKAYYVDKQLGNPIFEAIDRVKRLKAELGSCEDTKVDFPSVSDFRLWLSSPLLSIPCEPENISGPGLSLTSCSGLWYRYMSLEDLSSQECVAADVSLTYNESCSPLYRRDGDSISLIESLSFGLRVDFVHESNHHDISLQIPFTDPHSCSLTSPRLEVQPAVLAPPTICKPYQHPRRCLGPLVCEVTAIIELFPRAWSTVLTFLCSPGGKSLEIDDENLGADSGLDGLGLSSDHPAPNQVDTAATVSLVASLTDIRFFVQDPVLGPHLPVAVLSIGSLHVTYSRFEYYRRALNELRVLSFPEDMQVIVDGLLWIDYFKVDSRCWEPLLEAYTFRALYEEAQLRGSGVSLTSDTAFHLNISSALVLIVDQVFNSFTHAFQEILAKGSQVSSSIAHRHRSTSDRRTLQDSMSAMSFVHEERNPLIQEDRVAFSVRNLTGQKIRIYRLDSVPMSDEATALGCPTVTYLDHQSSMELSFQPSMSFVRNMSIVQVGYPGFENSSRDVEEQEGSSDSVDVQLPGFKWQGGINVDALGRGFERLVPRSEEVLFKANQDWRLDNIMRLLVEVGLENGGRQVTFRSMFKVSNETSHCLYLSLHPNPSYDPNASNGKPSAADVCCILPGQDFEVPTLLLEAALRCEGSHAGCLWFRPDLKPSDLKSFLQNQGTASVEPYVIYSSRPVQLAKLISETSLLFDANNGRDVTPENASTGVQMSCPILTQSGDRLAPFCYAVEVGRSPVVRSRLEQVRGKSHTHGPVAYTLSIHPPLVVVNLLPEKGRFELMHAVRRNVLWFSDLDPGQQVEVHSVGLDAPLLLLLNLGFCRTPVGEGALVHHGTDPPGGTRENLGGLKSIGKAGKAVTKQLGKTLTSLGDSPDRRGQGLMQVAQNPQLFGRDRREKARRTQVKGKVDLGLDTEKWNGADRVDGKTYRVETTQFFPQDIAIETSVVDSVGQRLTLNIENVRGGGAQRRISVFCPFWIVNTTEHSLRYRQEKSKNFVSGTVLSPSKVGSAPLSGNRAKAKYISALEEGSTNRRPLNDGTIFSGTPGALATSIGRSNLHSKEMAALIDKNIPLEKLATLAFMFNFHEGILSLGYQRLCVQLGHGSPDSRYTSDWSRGFSLESVGFSQVVGMHCKDGRLLELTVAVSVAPGILAGYTKIVRFLPRYVVVNALPFPVRVWQDSSVFRPNSGSVVSSSDEVARKDQKWRFAGKKESRRVNQYETLWGREAIINDGVSTWTTAHRSALYITTVMPSELMPFNLPDSRSDRQLRVGVGAYFDLTSSFSADVPGEHTLRINHARDLRLLKHVTTRSSQQYDIKVYPDDSFHGELGLWFETEWGSDRSLIVKSVKRNSFAYNETDVHIGDELLHIDGSPVSQCLFNEAMLLLRSRLVEIKKSRLKSDQSRPSGSIMRRSGVVKSQPAPSFAPTDDTGFSTAPLILTFRTVEERLRRIRLKAARTSRQKSSTGSHKRNVSNEGESEEGNSSQYLHAELRQLHNCNFLVLRETDRVPYQIQNRTINSTLYFRQKGCDAHQWQCLRPGQSSSYTWEEPLRPKRLSVRVASESAFLFSNARFDEDDADKESQLNDFEMKDIQNKAGVAQQKQPSSSRLALGKVKDDEEEVFSVTITVRLEEIGWRDFLKTGPRESDQAKFLELEVQVLASTRVLVVHDASNERDEQQMTRQLDALKSHCLAEEHRIDRLKALRSSLIQKANPHGPRRMESDAGNSPIENFQSFLDEARTLMSDFVEESAISRCHQLQIEILEAAGLNPDNYIGGACNPYAVINLKFNGSRKWFRKTDVRRTYFVKKSVNPVWNSQSFLFNVPEEAASVTRGHYVSIHIRNFRPFSWHSTLGKCHVDLHSLRDQKSMVGWFPLSGRSGGGDFDNPTSQWGRGSVKLRAQWVYTIPAMMDYFILLSEGRLKEIRNSVTGMSLQLLKKNETDAAKEKGLDGLKAVRLKDLLSGPKQLERNRFQTLIQPRLDSRDTPMERASKQTDIRRAPRQPPVSSPQTTPFIGRPAFPEKEKSRHNFSRYSGELERDKKVTLEALISKQRQNYQGLLSSSLPGELQKSIDVHTVSSGQVSIVSFKSWTAAQALFNFPKLVVSVDDLSVQVRVGSSKASERPANRGDSDIVMKKLCSPAIGLPSYALSLKTYAEGFSSSRKSFEKHARCALAAVTNPGGWLTVRPLTALNLEDTYSAMYVKVRYGSESFVSTIADSKVYPTWYKLDHVESEMPTVPDDDDINDMNIYVAPQKTSGSLRLSVVGERKHQKLTTKAELGILDLPLGAMINACIHASEDYFEGPNGMSLRSIPSYVRWFPLRRPKDSIPVEGDRGLTIRSPETEKLGDHLFKEYFAPCIQLAVIWRPDLEGDEFLSGQDDDDDHDGHSSAPTASQYHSRLVERYFNADIGQISAAIIDSQRAIELLSLSAKEIDIRYWVTKARTRMGIAVGWLQIDNQIENAREPVIFAPAPLNRSSTPVFHILAVKDNVRSKADVLSFQFIDVSVAEFDLTVEEAFLIEFFQFANSILLRLSIIHPAESSSLKAGYNSSARSSLLLQGVTSTHDPSLFSEVFELEDSSNEAAAKVYIEQLFLGIVRVNLSYLKGKKQTSWEVNAKDLGFRGIEALRALPQVALESGERLKRIFAFHHEKSDVLLGWCQQTSDDDRRVEHRGSKNLPILWTSLFPNVSDAPVRLQGKALNHVFESPKEILQSIKKYYVNETLRQIYKIIGALDFVGNPAMLFTSFFSGFRDLVVAPSSAFMRSPTDPSRLGIGVVKGTISLLSHSTSGFFGFASKVSAAAGQGLATLSFDADYRTWHRDHIVTEMTNLNREWKRRGVQNVGFMIIRPIGDIAYGIGGGVFGVVVSPVRGLRREGQLGLAKGFVQGGIGVFIKPAVGILDAFSHFSASVHDVAKSVNVLEKRYQPAIRHRLSYTFGLINILTPFSADIARAVVLLKLFPIKKRRRSDIPLLETPVHVEVLPSVGMETFAVATSLRVILIKVTKDSSGILTPSLCWEVSLVGTAVVSSRVSDHGHNGIALTLTLTKPPGDETASVDIPLAVVGDAELLDEPPQDDGGVEHQLPKGGASGIGFGAGTGKDFDLGTGHGSEGELLEWYTVLAEYQYRQQLARLHNAICCLVGDFDAVMHDPSLGHKGSSDGYTSFGLFHFQPESDIQESPATKKAKFIPLLENLQWVSPKTFEKYADKSPFEQESVLASLREKRDSLEIESSEEEPKGWLDRAFARAIDWHDSSNNPDLWHFSDAEDHCGSLVQTDEFADRLLAVIDEASSEISENEEVPQPRKEPVALDTEPFVESFVTAPMQSFGDQPSTVDASKPDDLEPKLKGARYQSRGEPVGEVTKEQDTNIDDSFFSPDAAVSSPPQDGLAEIDWVPSSSRTPATGNDQLSPESPVFPGISYVRSPVSTLEPDDAGKMTAQARMERMEALMERLLIFSAEQTLASRTSAPLTVNETPSLATEDTEVLRHEITQLRNQLSRQAEHDEQTQHDIVSLRDEIASLKANLDGRSFQNSTLTSLDEDAENALYVNEERAAKERKMPPSSV